MQPIRVANGALIRKKSTAQLSKGWADTMITVGETGGWLPRLCCALGITHEEHERLINDSPEYRRAYQISTQAAEAYWGEIGRVLAANGSAQAWRLTMLAHYRWTEPKAEQKLNDMSAEDLEEIASSMGIDTSRLGLAH